ncbi:hypothetical protein Tco_0965666 [Tanacetum coccineum]
MSSASTVTYTSVYTDSEPGRVFWGVDEELSDGGPEHPPSPDYVPGPEHPPSPVDVPYVPEPEYLGYLVPSNDEAPMEDQPLPADASVSLVEGTGDDGNPSSANIIQALWRVFWGVDEELYDGGPEHPPSPDYVPGPEHPPSPVEVPYVPEPEYPGYLVPFNDEAPMEDQPLPADASVSLVEGTGSTTYDEAPIDL